MGVDLWTVEYDHVEKLSEEEIEWCWEHLNENDVQTTYHVSADWLEELSDEAKKSCNPELLEKLKELIHQHDVIDLVIG